VLTWDDPTQRAAVWYVAAFGVLASVLLAGTTLSRFEWQEAAYPYAAVTAMGIAVSSAVSVVVVATQVLVPRFSVEDLLDRQRRAEDRLRVLRGSAAREDRSWRDRLPEDQLWREVADQDPVLRRLFTRGDFQEPGDSPLELRARARNRQLSDQERTAAADRLALLVETANQHAARDAFKRLRTWTPIASALILACALAWPALSRSEATLASASSPIPVTVTLGSGVDPEAVVGPGCHLRTLTGVAVSGDVSAAPLVAIPDQEACGHTIVRVTQHIGSVARTS
jgi:hypothetical protein